MTGKKSGTVNISLTDSSGKEVSKTIVLDLQLRVQLRFYTGFPIRPFHDNEMATKYNCKFKLLYETTMIKQVSHMRMNILWAFHSAIKNNYLHPTTLKIKQTCQPKIFSGIHQINVCP